jgi:heptosyltransferase-2
VSDQAKKYLIVGPAWVGDMVMAQSMFKLIMQQTPAAVIDVVAPAWTEPLLQRMPEVHEAIPVALGHGQLGLSQRWRLGKSLRDRHYDHAIVLPRSLKSAIVPFAAKARQRTGYLGELRWGLLNNIRPLDKTRLPRTVDRFNFLALQGSTALPSQAPQPYLQSGATAADVFRRLSLQQPDGPVLGLCPGAEYGPAKRWPARYFAELARDRLEKGWQVWLFGSEKDKAITGEIQQLCNNRCLDLAGVTKLAEAIDMMSLTQAVVTNDSGLMHVAAALDKPVVAIYGSSDPGFTPPLSDRASIVRLGLECSPCFKRECPLGHLKCLNDIKPEQVLTALETLL